MTVYSVTMFLDVYRKTTQIPALRIYLAEDCNYKFSLNIWTSNSVLKSLPPKM